MPLHEAIRTVMEAQGLKTPDLLSRMPQKDRSTVYRLLKGDTQDARVSTLLGLCCALGVTPNDLLSQAGLWNEVAPLDARLRRAFGMEADALDVRLCQAFGTVQGLASPYKVVAVTQVERLVGTWQEAAEGVLGRELES